MIAYCHIGVWKSNLRYQYLKLVIFLFPFASTMCYASQILTSIRFWSFLVCIKNLWNTNCFISNSALLELQIKPIWKFKIDRNSSNRLVINWLKNLMSISCVEAIKNLSNYLVINFDQDRNRISKFSFWNHGKFT